MRCDVMTHSSFLIIIRSHLNKIALTAEMTIYEWTKVVFVLSRVKFESLETLFDTQNVRNIFSSSSYTKKKQ